MLRHHFSKQDHLITRAVITTYEEGDLIIEQGDKGHLFFIILEGECDVFVRQGYDGFAERTPWGFPVARKVAGSYFGERYVIRFERSLMYLILKNGLAPIAALCA